MTFNNRAANISKRMAVLRSAHPYWLHRLQRGQVRRYPDLRGERTVDVAIVGGGIAGAAVAYELAASGFSIALIEALRIARGSTVASTALLMQEPDEDMTGLDRRYGPAQTRRIWELSREASDGFINLLKRLRIRCELEDRDSVYYTVDQRPRLYREYRRRRRAGLGGTWLSPDELWSVAGMPGAGIRTAGNAQVDPYQVCLGLIAKAVAQGAHVFEHTPAVRVQRLRQDCLSIRTPHGRLLAGTVVVATGFATPEFRPLLARFRMRHTYVLVTEPLPSPFRHRLGISDVMLWDTDRPYHYARWTADHRLMLGGGDRPRARGSKRRQAFRRGTREVHDYFVDLYPPLQGVRFDYTWEGLFATTPDGLPYIGPHRRYPGHLFALGYGGNGMTFSYLAARLIRERLCGRVTKDHELFGFGRLR